MIGNGGRRYRKATLDLRRQDEALLSLPSPLVLVDEALVAVTSTLESRAPEPRAPAIYEATQAIKSRRSTIKKYRTLPASLNR